MTPTESASPLRSFEHDRHDETKPDKSLASTLQAYEVEELTERDLGRFLAETVFKHILVSGASAAASRPGTRTRRRRCSSGKGRGG